MTPTREPRVALTIAIPAPSLLGLLPSVCAPILRWENALPVGSLPDNVLHCRGWFNVEPVMQMGCSWALSMMRFRRTADTERVGQAPEQRFYIPEKQQKVWRVMALALLVWGGGSSTYASSSLVETQALKQQELAVVQALVRDFPERLDFAVLMGNVLHRHGFTEEALEKWQAVLKCDPQRSEIYEELGWFAIEKGHYQEALTCWEKVLEIKPQARGVYSGMARALMGLNRHEEAVVHLQLEIERSPRSSFDCFLLGQEYLQLEQYAAAKEAYEKAIALDPNMTNAYYGLFNVCLNRGERDEAKVHMATFRRLKDQDLQSLKQQDEAYDDLAEMRREVAETLMRAGLAYQSIEQVDRAEKLLRHAAELAPGNADYHLHWGATAMQLGHMDQAQIAFGRVIMLAPKNARGYSGLAHLYLQTHRRFPEAQALAEKAVALEPTGFNYFVLSWASDRNGDRLNARVAIRRALELDPGNPRYRRIADHMENTN